MTTNEPISREQACEYVGRTVTVIPHRGVGESRDTEAGLQPWEAELVGVTLDGKAIVQMDGYESRVMNGAISVTPSGRVQIGSW